MTYPSLSLPRGHNYGRYGIQSEFINSRRRKVPRLDEGLVYSKICMS